MLRAPVVVRAAEDVAGLAVVDDVVPGRRAAVADVALRFAAVAVVAGFASAVPLDPAGAASVSAGGASGR